MSSSAHTLPVELVRPVLEHVLDRADVCSCALVNHVFYAESIAVLYRNINLGETVVREDVDGQPEVVHPCTTILQKPWYGRYVRYFSESPDVATMDPMLFMDFLAALRLCVNLQSFTWTFPLNAPHNRTERVLVDYLYVLKRLRVPKLGIRATHGLSAQVLTKLMYMNDLRSVSVQALAADPVRTESMAAALRERLTHFEFGGQDSGSRTYAPLFSRLRGLTSLTLRNTTNHDILEILTMLPVLTVLDAHYLPCAEPVARPASPACRLRHLTIHVDGQSTRTMWTWIPRLVPCTALESLTIRNRRISHSEQLSVKNWAIAPTFLRRVARIHAATLKRLAFDALCMTPEDFRLVCRAFIALETIACHLTKHDMETVDEAIRSAHEIRSLAVGFKVRLPPGHAARYAEQWLRREGSKLVAVTLRNDVFKGRWVYKEPFDGLPGGACFELGRSETDYDICRQMGACRT